MAQIINAAPTTAQRRSIGGYHWMLLVLSVVLTMLIALPTLSAQPVLYDTQAVIKADPQRYAAYFNDPEVAKSLNELAQATARFNLENQGFTGFGSNQYGVAIIPSTDGTITLNIHGLNPEATQAAANIVADRLMRNIRAAAGRDILQRELNAEEYRMWQGQPVNSDWNESLRQLIAFGAFDFPIRATPTAPVLSDEDYNDIARAMEVRYDQLTLRLSDPNAILAPLERRDLEVARRTLATFLKADYPMFQSTGLQASAAYIAQQAPLPLEPRARHLGWQIALVLAVGLIGGLLLVFVDHSIGIVAKLRELWQYRELIRNLVVRDLKARYKSSVLGYFWSLLNPLLMILLFYFVFRTLLGSPIVNFHIFLMVALLPWNYFAGGMTEGMTSIIGNANLVKKVYFPREILPLSTLLANLINFLLSLPVLFAVIFITGGSVTSAVLLLPVIVVIESVFLLGMILLLSALAVFFRDVTHIMGVIIQLWFFVTPVFYSLESFGRPVFVKLMRWINPMASIIDFYRDILYGGLTSQPTPGLPALDGVARTALTVGATLAIGAYVFHRLSDRFGEEL